MNGARSGAGDGLATAGLTWRVSSLCGGNGECVAVAKLPNGDVALSDTKERHGQVLRFSASEWRAFVAGVRAGEFDA
jgi:hypothetical protein